MHKASLSTVTAILTVLAKKNGRGSIIDAMDGLFPRMGAGMARVVYNVHGWAVKIRRGSDVCGTYGDEMVDESNKKEYEMYEAVVSEYPSLAQFILKPIYVKLPNKHDAIIMPLVTVVEGYDVAKYCDEDCEYDEEEDTEVIFNRILANEFTALMRAQHKFIRNHFRDSHEGNIGWDRAKQRVWIIDFNFAYDSYDDRAENAAKLLLRRHKRMVKVAA